MRFPKFEKTLTNLFAQNALLKFCVVLLTIGFFWLGHKIDLAAQHQTTILLPDHVSRKIVITGNQVPDDLIRDYTLKLTTLAFNYNPVSVRGQFGELVQYFTPDAFPQAKQGFYSLADTIERARLSQSFIISKPIEVDREKKIITVTGSQRQWVDSTFVDTADKIYFITYEVNNGLFQFVAYGDKIRQQPGPNTPAQPTGDSNAK